MCEEITNPAALCVVVMGVSGCGKSTVGALLANKLGADFIEGDHFHPQANVDKMASGVPLTDEDRWGWLQGLSAQLGAAQRAQKSVVLSCSALKARYRDVLQSNSSRVWFVYLSGSFEVLQQRVSSRAHQYMPASLLMSQLQTLEPPAPGARVLVFDVAQPAAHIAESAANALRDQAISLD